MHNSKENIIAGIELALQTIVPAATNKWVSVRDLSIVKVLEQAGLNKNYSPPLQEVLKTKGLMFTEGCRGGLRFTIKADAVVDFSKLAEEIYVKASYYGKSSEDGYPKSKSSDLKITKPKSSSLDMFESSALIRAMKRKIILPNMNDLVFVIHEGRIFQAVVLGMMRDFSPSAPEPQTKEGARISIRYTLIIRNMDALQKCPVESEIGTKILSDVSPKDIYLTIEDAAAHIVKQTVLFPKDLLKSL